MSNEVTKVCDTCGKHIKAESIDDTPVNWYTLSELKLYWGNPKPNNKYSNKLEILDDKDPDFCSEECAINWFKLQLKKIKTKKYVVN